MSASLYPHFPILVVEDEKIALETIEFILNYEGINNLILCHDPEDAADTMNEKRVGLVLLDLLMPYISGEELLSRIMEKHPETLVIIITGVNDIDTAVRCTKMGAYEYLVKPIDESRLLMSVKRAVQFQETRMENQLLTQKLLSEESLNYTVFSKIITRNRQMISIFKYIEAVAKSPQPILITGETGTGKELMAQAIHECSGREGQFVAVAADGTDDQLFSDMLFGHVKGAFTDARTLRKGMIETASGGTLFLDEIGELKPDSQIKLLRLIQESEYFPIGSDIPKRMDVKIVTATNADLAALVEKKKFRNDLFYRFNVHHITLPPLRERLDDIELLVDHFLTLASRELGKKKPRPPEQLYTLLKNYRFYGNVRELKSMIYDAVASHSGRMLSLDRFKKYMREEQNTENHTVKQAPEDELSLFSSCNNLPTVKQANEMLAQEALKRADGNYSMAAQFLGITRQTLSKYIKKREEG